MDSKKLEELKRKFFDGECSPDELRLLEKWMDDLPHYADAEPLDKTKEQLLEKTVWNSIQQRITPPEATKSIKRAHRLDQRFLNARAVAAAIGFIIVSAFAGYWYFAPSEVEWITVIAAKGSVEKVVLPDSSTVWLNSATTLRYPSSFEDTRKIMVEEGEVFFDVKHDPAKPFIVATAYVQTEVLGTSFSIKAYHSLPVVKVKVATGKVQVRDSLRILDYVFPNEQLTYRFATGHFEKKSVEADEIMGWRSRQLVFYRASFQEIALAIENRYQVKLDYNPRDVAHLQLTLKASSDWSLEQVLDMLATLSNTHYALYDQHVKIQLNL